MSLRTILASAGALVAASILLTGCSNDDITTDMQVSSASGHRYDLTGTTWVRCHADEPTAGESRKTVDVYSDGALDHTETVYDQRTDCTGQIRMVTLATARIRIGPDRTVTWNGSPPAGLSASVTASAVSFLLDPTPSKTLAFVDDTATPHRLYNGNEDGSSDAEGFPVQLEPLEAVKQ